MRKTSKKIGPSEPYALFAADFRLGVQHIQLTVFESVLRRSLMLPLQAPPLGLNGETWPDKTRMWLKQIVDAAHAASVAAANSAIEALGPLSPMMPHYASAARAQKARAASSKRVSARGGRPATVRWRKAVRALLEKNVRLTASDMLAKLEVQGVVIIDKGLIVFADEFGLRTSEVCDRKTFLGRINTIKYQMLR